MTIVMNLPASIQAVTADCGVVEFELPTNTTYISQVSQQARPIQAQLSHRAHFNGLFDRRRAIAWL
jgi:hypothetical protein